jgi:hypothetical protein
MADHPPAPTDPSSASSVAASRRSPLRRLAWAISSPWVSISLLVVVFIHQAVGSALYPVRQAFEVNEMEWFNGSASLLLWLVICLCLITASVVRVPWTWRRIGTHLSHLGVVLLVVTCTIYFAYKHEGDALLVRRYVKVESADAACRLLPNPGYRAALGAGTATVQSIMPRWTILSPEGKSEQAWAIMVQVSLPEAQPFTATLIEGRPDLTQYTLQGRQPTSFMAEFPAVVAAEGGIHALDATGKAVLATRIEAGARSAEPVAGGERSLQVDKVTADFPLLAEGFAGRNGTMVEWTLKSPAGQQSGSSIIGEPTLTRFQRARVKTAPDARLKAIALEPAPWSLAYNKDVPALWVRREEAARRSDPLQPMRAIDPESVASLAIVGLPRYHDHGSHVGSAPLAIALGSINGVDFTVTGFSPYARLLSRWKEDPEASPNPLLDLRFTSGVDGQSFPKVVAATTDASALEDTPLVWLHCADAAAFEAAMARLATQFPKVEQEDDEGDQEQAARTRLAFITTPGRKLTLFVGQPGRNLREFPLDPASEVKVDLWGDQVMVRLEQILQRPRKVTEPVPVPKDQQRSRMSVGDYESLIQVAATHGGRTTTTWVPYTPYPHLPKELGEDGALGMYAPRPVTIEVPGAGRFELCYAKAPLPMPGDIWMTGFHVPRRPGSDEPSEFFCDVGYGDLAAPQSATIHMNHPLEWRDTFFFQASWDPQMQALTILGVGNRPAGAAMLWASIVLALGMALSGMMAAFGRTEKAS